MATDNRKDTNPSALESQAVALAEQLGRIAGTIEGTAEQWLNRPALAEQLTRVRDSASQLLESLADSAAKGRQAVTGSAGAMSEQVRDAATKAVTAASSAVSSLGASVGKRVRPKRSSRKTASRKPAKAAVDLAHAPGKKHRKPAPSLRGVKKSDERIPKMRTATTVRQRRKSWA
jgi:ABC-type transporter Mla subunit MlaD